MSTPGEMSGILAEDTFVDVLEGGLSVGIVRDDAGPLVTTAVAGGPLGESLEFAGCVASIVSAVATTTFSLVLEVPLERVGE